MNRYEYDAEGVLVRSEVYDFDASTVSVTEKGVEKVLPIPADTLERLRADEREQKQLDRLDGKFEELKTSTITDTTRLTVANYGPVSQTDLRDMARLVNDLRAVVIDQRSMILDLTRLVRNMAAE